MEDTGAPEDDRRTEPRATRGQLRGFLGHLSALRRRRRMSVDDLVPISEEDDEVFTTSLEPIVR